MRKGKNDKKPVKKVQLDAGSEEGRGWGGLFRTKQNISVLKEIFFYKKSNIAQLSLIAATAHL